MNDTNWDEVMGLINDDLAKLDHDLELYDQEDLVVVEEEKDELKNSISASVSSSSLQSQLTAIASETFRNSETEHLSVSGHTTERASSRDECNPLDVSKEPSISPSLDEVSVYARITDFEKSNEDLRNEKAKEGEIIKARMEISRSLQRIASQRNDSVYSTDAGTKDSLFETAVSCRDISKRDQRKLSSEFIAKAESYRDVVNDAEYRQVVMPDLYANSTRTSSCHSIASKHSRLFYFSYRLKSL